jgi:FtsP/CotA-like multicopper oxidase with cupredoxin domain
MVLQFMAVSLQQTDFTDAIRVPFLVIGGDQGFAEKPTEVETLVFEPAARYDIIFDFADLEGLRIIIKNIGGDEPYGGDIPGPQAFEHTDKVMAFDVVVPLNPEIRDDYEPPSIERLNPLRFMSVDRTRKLGLFEGHDPFGRLQPLLGTLEEATDKDGNLIYWPDDPKYTDAGVTGPMVGTMGWNDPTTENIKLNDVEEWYVYNLTPDAHPVHLHMVNFMVVKRFYIKFDSNANEYGELEPDEAPVGDGTYHIDKTQVMHDGALGEGYQVVNPTLGELVDDASLPEYVENFPRDVVVALPGQVTVIRAKFDKPGRFNWHCHILSHEDQ